MKYFIAIISLYILPLLGFGQDFDFNVEVENPTCRFCKNGVIKINLKDTFDINDIKIYNKLPWEGGKLIHSININKSKEIIIKNLKRGEYFAIISFGKEQMVGKIEKIELSH